MTDDIEYIRLDIRIQRDTVETMTHDELAQAIGERAATEAKAQLEPDPTSNGYHPDHDELD